jgi:uncharacterized protein (DUF1330 family)
LPREETVVPAYILVDCEVTDPARYERYKPLASDAIARYGGRYLARGGETMRLEGDWIPKRVVVLEFPSLEAARKFYDSPEYREAREARAGGANMNMIAVAGT